MNLILYFVNVIYIGQQVMQVTINVPEYNMSQGLQEYARYSQLYNRCDPLDVKVEADLIKNFSLAGCYWEHPF